MYALSIIALRVLLARCVYPRTLIMLPGYAFIKTHKVGGTTMMYMLRDTLSKVNNATQCDYRVKVDNITDPFILQPELPTPTSTSSPCTRVKIVLSIPIGCRICANHDSYRQIAALVRSPSSLIAQSAVRKVCPFWVPERRIHTMIMLREPVDRLYARYHYELDEGWCRRTSEKLMPAIRGCASDYYQFVEWALLSDAEIARQRLYRSKRVLLHAETVSTLGGVGGVMQALRVLKLIHVVGVTERFNATLRVLSVTWGLPLHLLEQNLGHANGHTLSRPALNASFKLDMLAQSIPLQQEDLLYKYALQRLDSYNYD